ncbi:MAG: large subunit ribosomal protein L37e [archaeon GW2011_AR5]|nr:MAG: large subunit ribosomal protein L37e [archaeon GW2011_AR5]
MSKGTSARGKFNKITHIRCRRCGRHSYHIQKKECSACGYPIAKLKHDSWKWKPINRSGRKTIVHKHQKVKTARQGRHKSGK